MLRIKAILTLMSFLSILLRIFNTLITALVNKRQAHSTILKLQKTFSNKNNNPIKANNNSINHMKKKNNNKNSNKPNKSSLKLYNCKRNHKSNSNNKKKFILKLTMKRLSQLKYLKKKLTILFNLKLKVMSSLKPVSTKRQLISILKGLESLILNNFMEPHKLNAKKWLKLVPACYSTLGHAFSTSTHGKRLKFISLKLSQ